MPIEEKQPEENDRVSGTEAAGTSEPTQVPQQPRPEQTAQGHHTGQAAQSPSTEAARPRRRGFAAMDRDRVKQIASKGGRAAHAAGTAHQFNSDEARVAGKKGGMAPHVRRGGVRRRPADTTPTIGPTSHDRDQGERR
jgi:general stress protein YciG